MLVIALPIVITVSVGLGHFLYSSSDGSV